MTAEMQVAEEVLELAEGLLADGILRPLDELARYQEHFTDRFGPRALARMSPKGLAHALSGEMASDTLLGWLTRKDDAELPGLFGDTGHRQDPWAGQGATERRKELIAAAQCVEAARQREGFDWQALERAIQEAAPNLAPTAALHKYLSLLFPSLLSGFHTRTAQHHHLIKCLRLPPADGGNIAADGALLAFAQELGLPLAHLWATLEARNGPVRKAFRLVVGQRAGRRHRWLLMHEGGFVAMGRDEPGDLTALLDSATRAELHSELTRHFGDNRQRAGRAAAEFHRFISEVSVGDLILATDGSKVLGAGRVTGPYEHVDDRILAHRRPVEWLPIGELQWPHAERPRAALQLLGPEHAPALIAIERAVLMARSVQTPTPPSIYAPPVPPPLPAVQARIAEVLERKGQAIVHGPPGTGKTHHAEQTVRELAARSWFGAAWSQLSAAQQALIAGGDAQAPGAIEFCSFHPSFGYEDFLEGLRPRTVQGALAFELRDGLFKRLCRRAEQAPERAFFLIIDEINRGDVTRIFGELLTLLDRERRGQRLSLALSGELFSVPPNVCVIGTMNTADRSIALLDAALRRRFGFVELLPDASALRDAHPGGVALGVLLDALNEQVRKRAGRDGRQLQVGHAYLMHEGRALSSLDALARALRDDVIPLLQEYFYDDWDALEAVLGPQLIDRDKQRVHEAIFAPARGPDLIRALHDAFPALRTAHLAELELDEGL